MKSKHSTEVTGRNAFHKIGIFLTSYTNPWAVNKTRTCFCSVVIYFDFIRRANLVITGSSQNLGRIGWVCNNSTRKWFPSHCFSTISVCFSRFADKSVFMLDLFNLLNIQIQGAIVCQIKTKQCISKSRRDQKQSGDVFKQLGYRKCTPIASPRTLMKVFMSNLLWIVMRNVLFVSMLLLNVY